MRQDLIDSATALLAACRARDWTMATAESCTGGLIAGVLTGVPGCSSVLERGFVTYSNTAKTEMLGVPGDMLEAHGAVSEPVVRAMVAGALERAPVDLAVAVSGIAGPSGGTPDKPVGLVHVAAARRDGRVLHERHVFPGDRDAVRLATIAAAFALMRQLAEDQAAAV